MPATEVQKINTSGQVVRFNPKNGKSHSAALPFNFEHYAQGRISTSGLLAGGIISEYLNNLKVPWIWSTVRFDAELARTGATPVPDHEIFPNYMIYINGVKWNPGDSDIDRAGMERFIKLGENR